MEIPSISLDIFENPIEKLKVNTDNQTLKEIFNKNNNEVVFNEPWTDKREKLLLGWREHVYDMYKLHEEEGYKTKLKHKCLGLPTYILPIIMSFVQLVFQILAEQTDIICTYENNTCSCSQPAEIKRLQSTALFTNGAMWLIVTILSIIYTMLDLGNLYTLHFEYSSRYYDVLIRIDDELSKARKFRRDSDSFMTELRCIINNLNNGGPDFS